MQQTSGGETQEESDDECCDHGTSGAGELRERERRLLLHCIEAGNVGGSDGSNSSGAAAPR